MLDKNDNVCYNGDIDPAQGQFLTLCKQQGSNPERQEPLKVVYDVDDVLWGLNQRVMKLLDLDIARSIEFRISASPTFTPSEQQAILACFHDAKIFEHIKFYPGARQILAVEPYGATVRIHSNCFTDAIAAEKRHQLERLLPTLKPAFIKLATITPETNRKRIDQDAYIFVDDNPYNIATSTAKFNFVPEWPWNQTEKARQTMTADGKIITNLREQSPADLINSRHRYIIYGKSLRGINQAVIDIVKAKQGANHVKK